MLQKSEEMTGKHFLRLGIDLSAQQSWAQVKTARLIFGTSTASPLNGFLVRCLISVQARALQFLKFTSVIFSEKKQGFSNLCVPWP